MSEFDASDYWEDKLTMPESGPALSTEDFNAKYDRLITRIQELAVNLGTYMWEIGDAIVECDNDYNLQDMLEGCPSYLLIGCHPPNFWKQLSDTVGLSVASLKLYANVARAFPPDKRLKELTWSHHVAAHIYEDRDKYLRKAVDDGIEETGRPWTIRQLEEYIDQQENCVQHPTEPHRTVSIEIPLPMMRKFTDLAKHFYHRPVNEIVAEAVKPALEAYLEQKAQEISLQFFQWHDGKTWPFGPEAKKNLAPKRCKPPIVSIRHVA